MVKCVNRLFRVLTATAMVALAAPTASSAAIITFDNAAAPALFANATALTNQFAGLGVVFSGTGAVVNSGSSFGVTGFSAPNFLAYRDGVTIDFAGSRTTSRALDSLQFMGPISTLSFLVGSGTAISAGDMFQVRAFQGATLVDTRSLTLAAALQMLTVTGTAITRVDYGIVAPRTFDGFVVDDLNFTTVPEPASMALLGSGLAAFALARVRRRRF